MSRDAAVRHRSVRFAILGPGALGIIFAAALHRTGYPVVLVGHPSPWTHEIQVNGVRLESLDGVQNLMRLPVSTEAKKVAGADALVILVKTVSTREALAGVAPHITAGTTIVTLQNGLGNADEIREVIGATHIVLSGTTSQAARRVMPNTVVHTGAGPTVIGYASDDERSAATRIAGALSDAGLPAAAVPDIDRWLWRKAAINAAVNGLTALAGVSNGAILADQDLFSAADAVAEEAAAVARAGGIELGDLRQMLRDTLLATAANRSSMLQDVEAGRPTEVESIQGAIVRRGREVGVSTPLNALLTAVIKAKAGASHAKDATTGDGNKYRDTAGETDRS